MCRRVVLTLLAVAAMANAQWQLDRENSDKVDRALKAGVVGDQLKCSVKPLNPFLDFAFRFDAGYFVSCPVKEFGGRDDTVISYVRITPDNGAPVVLANGYRLPAISRAQAKKVNLRKVNSSFEMSGGFVLGEGPFTVDLLLMDSRNRICHAHWTVNTRRSGHEKNASLAMPPNTAAAFPVYSWDGKPSVHRCPGSRLTILLDVAPMNPSANKLRAWDRAFLLGALSSLLRQMPADSVRLVAFNLDQQREIFRQDRFDGAGFTRLAEVLKRLELGTISYKALQQQNGWAELLAQLVNEQITEQSPTDTVLFLGPNTRITDKLPETMLRPCGPRSPRFFYFEYFPFWRSGSEFPDAIHYATRACKGTTLKIHSAGEFAEAMRKVNQRLAVSSGTRHVEEESALTRYTALPLHAARSYPAHEPPEPFSASAGIIAPAARK